MPYRRREDFDRAACGSVQVKCYGRHFAVQGRYRGHRQPRVHSGNRYTIKFRFLTTAGIGIEQGAPFGVGMDCGSGATADCQTQKRGTRGRRGSEEGCGCGANCASLDAQVGSM
jgi:hypothetical protein